MENENLPKSNAKPQIREYLDARKYLCDFYEWRKRNETGFSYSTWALELGFKSRSFLRLVLIGKRSITENSLPAFTANLNLTAPEAEYFRNLVRFTQASSVSSREHYAKELSKKSFRKSTKTNIPEVRDHYAFLSSHLGPRVQALLTLEDVEKTATSLARLLRARETQVTEILERLERLGLAERHESGDKISWKAVCANFEVKDHLGDVALQSFHRKSLEEAIQAIDESPSLRKFQSIVVPLSPEEYQEMQNEIYSTLSAILERFGADRGENRRLYQINVNLIPVTGPILRHGEYRRVPVGSPLPKEKIHETIHELA